MYYKSEVSIPTGFEESGREEWTVNRVKESLVSEMIKSVEVETEETPEGKRYTIHGHFYSDKTMHEILQNLSMIDMPAHIKSNLKKLLSGI